MVDLREPWDGTELIFAGGVAIFLFVITKILLADLFNLVEIADFIIEYGLVILGIFLIGLGYYIKWWLSVS